MVKQHGFERSSYRFDPFSFTSKSLDSLGATGVEPKYISGCFWGISKKIWRRTGGFSTSYFLYFEELDFIYRYKSETGLFPDIRVFKNIKVTHLEGGSTGSSPDKALTSPFSDYWTSRSRIIFARTHLKKYIIIAIFYNILKAVVMSYKLRGSNTKNIIKGTIDGLFV